MTDLVYAIYRPRLDDPSETVRMSWGTREGVSTPVPEFAAARVTESRACHSYYGGPLTVYVWELREDESYRMPIPEGAHRFEIEGAPVPKLSPPPAGFRRLEGVREG